MGQGFHITHPARRGKTGVSQGAEFSPPTFPTLGKSTTSPCKNSCGCAGKAENILSLFIALCQYAPA